MKASRLQRHPGVKRTSSWFVFCVKAHFLKEESNLKAMCVLSVPIFVKLPQKKDNSLQDEDGSGVNGLADVVVNREGEDLGPTAGPDAPAVY